MAIGCAIAAPFTAGLSLVPGIIVGVVAATAGSVTAGGAAIVGTIIDKAKMWAMESRWKAFQERYTHLPLEGIPYSKTSELKEVTLIFSHSCILIMIIYIVVF